MDITLLRLDVKIRHSVLGMLSIKRMPAVGSRTNTLVDKASASITVFTITVTLALTSGDRPFFGLTM